MRPDYNKLCPNCRCPYYWATGVGGQLLGMEGRYGCGYLDSEDGIAPPTIPPACAYAKSLLDMIRREQRLDKFWGTVL